VPPSSRAIAASGWILTALSLTALALFMSSGRALRAPAPAWNPARFVPLRRASPAPKLLWLVPVNLECPHCRASLPALLERAHRSGGAAMLEALLVDTPARPEPDTIATLAAEGVWWDSLGIWRRSWKRMAYGEVLVFDSTGAFRGTLAPETP
jgi:hypothetical protein